MSFTFASACVGFFVGGITQVVTKIMLGNDWRDGVIGAAVGGAVYNAVAINCGPIAAGYLGAAAEATANELYSYVRGKKSINADNLNASIVSIQNKALANGPIYGLCGKLANMKIPSESGGVVKEVSSLFCGQSMGTISRARHIYCVCKNRFACEFVFDPDCPTDCIKEHLTWKN